MFDLHSINQLVLDTRKAEDQVEHNRLFSFLLDAIRPVMVHACRRRTVPGTDLDDRMQMASMATLDAVERFDPKRGNFAPFVREVILRQLSNQYRKQTADKRATLNVSVSLDAESNTGHGRKTSVGAAQAINTDRRPHLADAHPPDGLSSMLACSVAAHRRMFWAALRIRLSNLERQVLDGLLRGDTPAETADTINYYRSSDEAPAQIDAAAISALRMIIIRKTRRLARRFCPELVDSLFVVA